MLGFVLALFFSLSTHAHFPLETGEAPRPLALSGGYGDQSFVYGAWVEEAVEHHEARTEEEIRWVFSRWPTFKEHNPADYRKVTLEVRSLRWEGETSCRPGDPRLSREDLSFTVIAKSASPGGRSPGSFGGASTAPQGDPCDTRFR
jgi:hypothetical protein